MAFSLRLLRQRPAISIREVQGSGTKWLAPDGSGGLTGGGKFGNFERKPVVQYIAWAEDRLMTTGLSPEQLHAMDAFWRAAMINRVPRLGI
jgi:hypothetical protein